MTHHGSWSQRYIQSVVEISRPGGKGAVKAAYLQLAEAIGDVSTRELRAPHPAHTKRLAQLQERLKFPGRPVPGLTTHQAKGDEWQVVGLRLRPDEQAALAAGLDSAQDLHRKTYVACTTRRAHNLHLGPSVPTAQTSHTPEPWNEA